MKRNPARTLGVVDAFNTAAASNCWNQDGAMWKESKETLEPLEEADTYL